MIRGEQWHSKKCLCRGATRGVRVQHATNDCNEGFSAAIAQWHPREMLFAPSLPRLVFQAVAEKGRACELKYRAACTPHIRTTVVCATLDLRGHVRVGAGNGEARWGSRRL